MSTTSTIEWTDKTWNPVRGCSIVSPGCVNCYAMKQAHRFSGEGRAYHGLTKLTAAGPQWTGAVRCVDEALGEPLRWRKPARVFVNSMSDLFHENVPDAFIDQVFAVMALAPQHTFQVLTKRAERMLDYMVALDRAMRLPDTPFPRWRSEAETMLDERKDWKTVVTSEWPLPNVWLGVSGENGRYLFERMKCLRRVPAAVRFVSLEPLLEDVADELRAWLHPGALDWVIVGGESGPGARSFDLAWARSIVRRCKSAGVACFVKQLGANVIDTDSFHDGTEACCRLTLTDKKGGDPAEWPADLRVRQFPTGWA